MPVQTNTNNTGALAYSTVGINSGVLYDSLMNNTTTSIWQGQLVSVIVDTSINAAGLPAVQQYANVASTAALTGGRIGVALSNAQVTNSSSTSTFQAINKVGGPVIVDVAYRGSALVALTSGTPTVGSYVFPSTSAAGLATTTASYQSLGSTASAWLAGQSLGVVLSTTPFATNSTGQNLYLCYLTI